MDLFSALISIFILIYSSIFHEIAHGFVAYRLGDPTAKLLGRLTLNPIKHIDPFMSVIFPAILIFSGSPIIFGGAKPVPIDPFNLKEGRKDIALVSLAGPLTNILIAIIASVFIHIMYPQMSFLAVQRTGIIGFCLSMIVFLNLLLAVFNLMPIPPLDGSKIFAFLLPKKEAAAYLSLESIGMYIIFALLFFPIGPFSLMGLVQGLLTFSLSLLGF
ncbi:site-2 protease family protein [Patescibacteria group bacterium]|nr:site-2 protease family protein [Patescibacteria group bacterium]MBU4016198.1 site-2 protease family protein [Patescibacteria group bacterium]